MIRALRRFGVLNRSAERVFSKQTIKNGVLPCFCLEASSRVDFHTSLHRYKKRRSEDERKSETKTGRQVIRYSPKNKNTPVVEIWNNMSVKELSQTLRKDTDQILEAISFSPNATGSYNEKSVVFQQQVIKDVVKICGYKFVFVLPPDQRVEEVEVNRDAIPAPPAPEDRLRPRPPVVTVMGHVDHGKTTLLDALRNTSVVEQEFGGITQHIGAFEVKLNNGEVVTFLDTPGHAAFTAMRARGANVTDIVVLVVAADDGVMEQTIESIRMANNAKVPIIVAVNKVDKHTADIERTHRLLSQQGIHVEQVGGDVQSVPISALKRTNLDLLVETISVQAQLKELKADPDGPVEGVVVECLTDPKLGKLATMIIQRGTLKKGTIIVAGEGWAKVRLLMNHEGKTVEKAPPSFPVQVVGWRTMPSAGDVVLEVPSEKRAGEVMKWRQAKRMEDKQKVDYEVIKLREAEHRAVYKEKLERRRLLGRYKMKPEGPREKLYQESNDPMLNIIVKGDVDGSVEAILDVLDSYDDQESCKFDLVHFGVGQITESDVELADPFQAIIYSFNLECPKKVELLAEQLNVTIKHHNIIYRLVNDLKEELNLRIPMSKAEELLGEANVLQPFTINERNKKVTIAGCRCLKGVLKKSALFRIVRGENQVVYEGSLMAMKHFKDDVETIKRDMECGLRFEDSKLEIQPGDRIICYHMIDVKNVTKWMPPGF